MSELFEIVDYIVKKGQKAARLAIPEEELVLDYVAIFCKSEDEKLQLENEIKNLGDVAEETSTGKTYKLSVTYNSPAGQLNLIKLRNPDNTRPQRGEPDFRVKNYAAFKQKYINIPGMKLIERSDYEMLELSNPKFDILVYFPNKPLGLELGL